MRSQPRCSSSTREPGPSGEKRTSTSVPAHLPISHSSAKRCGGSQASTLAHGAVPSSVTS